MRVAMYHPWIHCRGGAEKVLLEILNNSGHDIELYASKVARDDTFDALLEHDIQEFGGIPMVGEVVRGISFGIGSILTNIPLSDFDIFVVSTGGVGELITLRNDSIPTMAYCHTPLRIAHDPLLRKHKFAQEHKLKTEIYRRVIHLYNIVERKAWEKFEHVMFNSHTTQRRALRAGLISENDTSVNHPGVDTRGREPGKYRKYFLYPSRFTYYKRQGLALQAYKLFRNNNPQSDFQLILSGSVNSITQKYYQKIYKEANKIRGVTIEHNVAKNRWRELYRNCYTVLFTGINEDWGIVPLEAGSHEKPVISVNEGGPTESIIDGETGLLVEPSPQAIAEAMEELSSNKNKVIRMGKRGKTEARNYTWDEFVDEFDKKIAEICG